MLSTIHCSAERNGSGTTVLWDNRDEGRKYAINVERHFPDPRRRPSLETIGGVETLLRRAFDVEMREGYTIKLACSGFKTCKGTTVMVEVRGRG